MAAARVCFASRGYYQTQSKDIAREAGVAVGTFYEYFKDKAAVFRLVLDDLYTAFEDLKLESHLVGTPGAESWAALLADLRGWVDSFGRLFGDFYTLGIRDQAFEEILSGFESRIEARLAEVLSLTLLAENRQAVPSVAALVYTVIESLLLRSVIEHDEGTGKDLLREASVCLHAYLSARSGAESPKIRNP